jgi:hypothetical protein
VTPRILEAGACFSPDLTSIPLSFPNSGLFFFALVGHCHKYDYMLSPVSAPSEIMKSRSGS